jgi:excisionase family DNA binding protein
MYDDWTPEQIEAYRAYHREYYRANRKRITKLRRRNRDYKRLRNAIKENATRQDEPNNVAEHSDISTSGGVEMISYEDRVADLTDRYGEVCTKSNAAKILGVHVMTIKRMIADGRICSACAGNRVDVRSIAKYIAEPGELENSGRINRIKQRYGSSSAV